jgi:Glu-tRNA(Gln) amidotransferase subunit E-like FAD-binding protein
MVAYRNWLQPGLMSLVSCRGGTRVEIKGVAHTSWMPELTHNEASDNLPCLGLKDLLRQNCRIFQDGK